MTIQLIIAEHETDLAEGLGAYWDVKKSTWCIDTDDCIEQFAEWM